MTNALRILAFTALAASLAAQEKPNFVVILSDDQSWVGSSIQIDPADSHTRSGYFRTPQLERLARRGVTFADGYGRRLAFDLLTALDWTSPGAIRGWLFQTTW